MPEATGSTSYVYNTDVVGLYNRINRFLVEIDKSVSSNVSDMNAFDQQRLKAYLTAITTYQAWVVAQPALDLPETSPHQYVLEDKPTIVTPESEVIDDVERMLTLARDELINSQSARNPSGLIKFDNDRLTAIVGKVSSFLDQYVATATPLDLPESSPKQLNTGAGVTGADPA